MPTVPAASLPPEIAAHPHARAVLAAALTRGGAPSHAYLFHGPPGTGKRAAARALAALLLAEGARAPHTVTERVARDAHPDLTWIAPSGSSELLVSDIAEPVVAALAHTPFESARRVWVIEAAGTMNDQAANRLLKTLEEPPSYAHLILLAEHREDVLPTILSRCQPVRFDSPPADILAQQLLDGVHAQARTAPLAAAAVQTIPADSGQGPDAEPLGTERALACARLSGGDAQLAGLLATPRGAALREWAEDFARDALRGEPDLERRAALLELARVAGADTAAQVEERARADAELLPAKERRRHEREATEAARRAERRARTAALDLALTLVELWLRDVWCTALGAPELAHAADRATQLADDARGRDPRVLADAVALVRDTRLRLALNVAEELALEALAYRLVGALGSSSA